jgi:single-strand DNA-binding protein
MKSVRNSVRLIGHVGMNPSIFETENGGKLVKFSLATSEFYKNKTGERVKNTQWHNLVIWGPIAKIAEEHVQKGSEIAVEGRLVSRSYMDKSGTKKYITEVMVNEIALLGRKKETQPAAETH